MADKVAKYVQSGYRATPDERSNQGCHNRHPSHPHCAVPEIVQSTKAYEVFVSSNSQKDESDTETKNELLRQRPRFIAQFTPYQKAFLLLSQGRISVAIAPVPD